MVVLKRTLDHGVISYHSSTIPRGPRSARVSLFDCILAHCSHSLRNFDISDAMVPEMEVSTENT